MRHTSWVHPRADAGLIRSHRRRLLRSDCACDRERCSAGHGCDCAFLVGRLSRPGAVDARLLLKTATALGLPVSVVQGRCKPGDRWLPSDTIAALAWQSFTDSLCPSCGNSRHESMDPDSDGEWWADLPMRCHACTAIAARAKEYREATAPEALAFSAERRARKASSDA